MDIRGAVDAAVPTNIIAAKAAEVRANKVNWQSYLQWVLIYCELGVVIGFCIRPFHSHASMRNTGKY